MFLSLASSLLKYKVTRTDGTNDFVTMGNVLNRERNLATTVGGWFKWTTPGAVASVFNKLQNTTPFPGWDIFFATSGAVGYALYNQGDTAPMPNRMRITTTATTFGNNRWHHIVASHDGTSAAAGMRIDIDGVTQAVNINANNLTASILTTDPLCFGARGGVPLLLPYAGVAHDLFIYNKQLSLAEAQAIHNSHCPPDLTQVGPTGNLIGYWLAGEHKGDVNLASFATSGTNVPDASGGGNAGTMTNGPTTETRR